MTSSYVILATVAFFLEEKTALKSNVFQRDCQSLQSRKVSTKSLLSALILVFKS